MTRRSPSRRWRTLEPSLRNWRSWTATLPLPSTAWETPGLEREDLTAAKVLRSAGATCEEGAVLVFTSGDQAQTAVQVLGDYVQKQIDSNRDYRPQELPKLESAVIQQRENTVLLLVAGDLEAAQGVLEQ